jgi:hypothetical protein
MGRPSAIPTEEKVRLVLSVISGEMTLAQAALGEAHVQLRVWRKSAEGRLGPLRTSR